MVLRHPTTGREALFLGRRRNAWIVGLPESESDALLETLWAHIDGGEYFWAQQWQPGDVVIWDNRFTLHRRDTRDPAHWRLMYRTQVRDTAAPAALAA